MKCDICGKKIEETFLGKLNGTLVKIKEGDKNRTYHACSGCQRKYQDKLREEIKGK